jgi:hypothetical protein
MMSLPYNAVDRIAWSFLHWLFRPWFFAALLLVGSVRFSAIDGVAVRYKEVQFEGGPSSWIKGVLFPPINRLDGC